MFRDLVNKAHALPEIRSNGHPDGCEVWYGNEKEQYCVEYDLSGKPISVQIVGTKQIYYVDGRHA